MSRSLALPVLGVQLLESLQGALGGSALGNPVVAADALQKSIK